MIQHLMLIMVAPPLLVTGQPATLLLHASRNPLHTQVKKLLRSRVITAITFPAVGVVAYAVTIVGTHLTSFMNLVMQNDEIHNAEHALYLIVGYLYFLPLVGREPLRWKLSYPVRLFLLFIAMPVDAFTGVVLGMSSSVPWSTMATQARPSWAPNALDDVHIGGGVMWVGGAAIMFVVIMLVFLGWSRDTRTSSRSGWLENARRANIGELVNAPVDRGDVDDDDHLDAYNAYLARLNGTDKH
jgi:putative copper resistance protein D